MGTTEWVLIGIIIFGIFASASQSKKKRKRRNKSNTNRKTNNKQNFNRRTSMECRSDEVILSSPLDDLSGPEFERLLALYFRGQGYEVKEVGVGGNDGGADLVIIDKRGERTAVQAKCYADHNNVGVQTVRELVAAKRNHGCILSLLITTSDLTQPAKKEADQFKVEYWHGALIEQKLSAWGKWQPVKKRKPQNKIIESAKSGIKAAQSQVAVSTNQICVCGAKMIKRTNKEGKQFWGCSNYPKCRHTKSI